MSEDDELVSRVQCLVDDGFRRGMDKCLVSMIESFRSVVLSESGDSPRLFTALEIVDILKGIRRGLDL